MLIKKNMYMNTKNWQNFLPPKIKEKGILTSFVYFAGVTIFKILLFIGEKRFFNLAKAHFIFMRLGIVMFTCD